MSSRGFVALTCSVRLAQSDELDGAFDPESDFVAESDLVLDESLLLPPSPPEDVDPFDR